MGRIRDRIAERRAQREAEREIEEQQKSEQQAQAKEIEATQKKQREAEQAMRKGKQAEADAEVREIEKQQATDEKAQAKEIAQAKSVQDKAEKKINAERNKTFEERRSEALHNIDRKIGKPNGDTKTQINNDTNEEADLYYANKKLDADTEQQATDIDDISEAIKANNAFVANIEEMRKSLTPEQRAAFDNLDTNEDRAEYLRKIGKKVIPEDIYNRTADTNKLTENGRESRYDYETARSETSPLVDMIHSGNSFVDAYRNTYQRPTAPEYDPRRERALNWQKAIIALGQLGGLISDFKNVGKGGIVYARDMGKTQMDAADNAIDELRAAYSNSYNRYVEADKAYLDGLYEAYKTDAQQRINTGKELAKKFNIDQSYSYADADNALALARIRANRSRASAKGQNPNWYEDIPVYGRDRSGNQILLHLTKNNAKNLKDLALAQFYNDENALRDFLAKYADDTYSDLTGFSLAELNAINSDSSLSEEEKQMAKRQVIDKLFAGSDKQSPRRLANNIIQKNPMYGIDWAIKTGNKQVMDYAEAYGGLPAGSLSIGAEDRIDIVKRITNTFDENERIAVREQLRRTPLNDLLTIYEERIGQPYVLGGGQDGTRSDFELPPKPNEEPRVIKVGDNYYYYDDESKKTKLTPAEIELIKKLHIEPEEQPNNSDDDDDLPNL